MIPLMVNLDIGPKLGFKNFSKNFFIRAGFSAMLASGIQPEANVLGNFLTPYIGINYQRFMIGNIKKDGINYVS